MMADKYKHVHQPFVTIQSKPTYEQLETRWRHLKECIELTIDNYQDMGEHMLGDYIQILDVMKKLEGGE